MTVFRIVSTLLILVLAGWMAFDLRGRLGSWSAVVRMLGHHAGTLRIVWPTAERTGPWRENFRNAAYVLSAGMMVLLALTGFLPVLFTGSHLSGILLVVHVTIAPLFALALTGLSLLWAHRMTFGEADWRTMTALGRLDIPEREAVVRFALKAGFWSILTISLPLMLTIILGMFPLFGTDGESLLIRLHGYSALLLLLAALSEIYLTITYLERNPHE